MPAPLGNQYAVGNEGGRPSKYTKEFIENEAKAFMEWMKNPNNIYFKKFALERGYSANRLKEFADQNEEFSVAYEIIKDWHEVKIVEGALTSKLNGSFAKFLMAHTCGWHDQKPPEQENPMLRILREIEGKSEDLVGRKAYE